MENGDLCSEKRISNKNRTFLEQENIQTMINKTCGTGTHKDRILAFKKLMHNQASCICSYEDFRKHGTIIISSGIESFDCLINGGFLTGNIYEICGLSGVGKSQICVTIIANIVSKYHIYIHYISTKGDFKAEKIWHILHNDYSEEETIKRMKKIMVTKVADVYQLINVLNKIKHDGISGMCGFIVIDSICSIYFPFVGVDNPIKMALLNYVASIMKFISIKYNIVFLVTNMGIKCSSMKISENCPQLSLTNNNGGCFKPYLGNYWSDVCNTRFSMCKSLAPCETVNGSLNRQGNVVISVLNSDLCEIGKSCNLILTN